MGDIMNLAAQPEYTIGKVYQFPKNNKKSEIDPLEKECSQLKKDGTPKKTKNNSKKCRDKVCPIKEEDVNKFVEYFYNKAINSPNYEDAKTWRRNLAGFIMNLNIGLRASDMVRLKWSDIYDENWNFLETKSLEPKKTSRTGKHIEVQYSDVFRLAVDQYRDFYKPEDKRGEYNSYIFKSRQVDKETGKVKCIEPDTWALIMKKSAKEIGIEYNVASHSIRKGFARIRYDHAIDKSDAIVKIMETFRHSDLQTTMRYVGIRQDEMKEFFNMVDVGMDSLMKLK